MRDLILAVETGGTKIQMALGTAGGTILYNYRTKVNREKGFHGILAIILESMPELADKARQLEGSIERIGIGFGGPVNTKEGKAIWSAQIDGWGGFPVKEYFQENTGIETFLFNDSDAAAWGEYCCGAGKGSEVFYYTNIGSGVGGGAVLNGNLYTGQGYGAVEFGQSYIYNPFWDKDSAYPMIQLERVCSGWSIEKRMRQDEIPQQSVLWELCGGNKKQIDCKMWSKGIAANDSYCVRVLDETAELFSIALSNVICFFSPQTIAVGGGVSLIGEPLISRLNFFTSKYIYKNSIGKYKIVKSELDEAVVVVGTLLLSGKQ